MVNVVVQTAFLGDVLLSIPLLKKIKALYPLMDLILVCRRGVGDFFIKTGLVQQVLEVEKNQSSSYKKALAELQTKDIYHLVAPHESFRTAVFCWQLKAKNKTSFSQPWSFLFFQQRIKKNKLWPEALRQLSLVQDLDSQLKQNLQSVKNKTYTDFVESKLQKVQLEPVPPWASMSLKNFFADLDTPVRLFKKYKKTVLLFPGSVWATKQWTEEGFVQVAQKLFKTTNVYILGAGTEIELCQRIAYQSGAYCLAGKTSVFESAQIIAQADLVIANDSAPSHLASACDVPVISLFGPTVIEFGYRPWQNQTFIMQDSGLACRPCGPHGHRQCPLGTHACMKNITAEKVFQLAQGILQ